MNTLNKNILANYIGKLWSFVSIFIFIRFYIDILGIQSYAIINFYSVILGLLAFADSGLTATLNRELAQENSIQDKSDLVYTFERIYLGICLLVIGLVIILSDYMATNSLQSELYTPNEISYFIKLIGIGIGVQLFSTLYEGGLMGLQKQVLANKIKVFWSLFRSGIVIIPLLFFPTLEFYFIWQILCNVVLLILFRKFLWKELKFRKMPVFSTMLLKKIWKYALGMMGIALISAINIQIDKLVTSRLLDLKYFGFYSLATTIAQVPLLVATPIIAAVFPIFSMLVSTNNLVEKRDNFHKFSFIITLITAPIALCVFLYSIPLVSLWTGDINIANNISLTVKILIIGGFFLCLQLIPYYVALANGHTKINIVTGIFGLFLVVPLMIYSVGKYGMIGASFPWLLINFLSFLIISVYIINRFLPKQIFKWISQDILAPTFVTILVGVIVYFLMRNANGKYWFLLEIGLITIISLICNVLLYNKKNQHRNLFDFNSVKIKFLRK